MPLINWAIKKQEILRNFCLIVVCCLLCGCVSQDISVDTATQVHESPMPVATEIVTESRIPTLTLQANERVVPVTDFPGYVIGLVTTANGYLLIEETLCMTVWQSAVWEPGDYWDRSTEGPLVKVMIDGERFWTIEISSDTFLYYEVDDDNNLLGVHGGSFQYCVIPTVANGVHSIELVS